MKFSRPLSLALAPLVAAATASATNQYALDDGTMESAIGYSLPEDYCWLQSFEAVGGFDTITKVMAFLPPNTPVGTPITFCVWDDPNDDGDPNDAILVVQRPTTVQYAGLNVFVDYPLMQPAPVHGTFFVGAFLTEDGTMGPAALDYSTNPHKAWFSFNSAGMFDPTNLSNNFPPTHIETIGAGIHGAFLLRAQGSGDAPTAYCTPKTNSLGCVPEIGWFGSPSASAGNGFVVTASAVRNRKFGLLLYTTAGRAQTPFFGGTLCLANPLHRTPSLNSGGSFSGDDCTGVYAFDFNVHVALGLDPALVAGATVDAQYYSRDPGFPPPDNVGLTNALEFVLGP